jgi:GDPmannose 4,6-dehydratase
VDPHEAGARLFLHYLGNLEAQRDWGYAPEYVEAMWHMLQQEAPDHYVIGTGMAHTVQEFVERAFAYVGLEWQKYYVEIDPRYFRPTEVHHLRADPSRASARLGWESKVSFAELIAIMVDADMEAFGLHPVGHGEHILTEKFSR